MGFKSRQKHERRHRRRQFAKDVAFLLPGGRAGEDLMNHNYVRKLAQLYEAGRLPICPGRVSSVTVAHDDACGIFSSGYCDCDLDIQVKLLPSPEDN